MERLTKREKVEIPHRGGIVICNHDEKDCNDFCMYTNPCKWYKKALDKLKAYEDLEERCHEQNYFSLSHLLDKWECFLDEVQELLEYRRLEEQGLLLRLPCKVGDTVYYIDDYYIYKDKVNSIDIRKENGEYIFCIAYMDYKAEDFGKSVFLSIEEAEQALAEMGGE